MRALYGWLLYLYPAEFRQTFGEEMSGVFSEVSADLTGASFTRRTMFMVREIAGIMGGACEEQVRSLTGFQFVFRRENMRSNRFRFPWSGIGLMTLILGMVVVAIHNARDLSQKFAGTTMFQGKMYSYQPEQISLLHTFGFAFGVTFVCAVVIWAVLHRMHRSGVHRLSDAQTWPQ